VPYLLAMDVSSKLRPGRCEVGRKEAEEGDRG
jgi:hypothetical protein